MSDATVFVVDDDPPVRRSLQQLMRSVDLPVAVFASAEEFLAQYTDQPGCLLLDLRMPGMGGLELQQRLAQLEWRLPVIIISGNATVHTAVQAMKGGAIDLLAKPYRPPELLSRVREALKLDAARRERRASQRAAAEAVARLSPREREVCERLVRGETSKRIALALDLSSKTVDVHRAHIFAKLGQDTIAQVVAIWNLSQAASD